MCFVFDPDDLVRCRNCRKMFLPVTLLEIVDNVCDPCQRGGEPQLVKPLQDPSTPALVAV